MAAKLNNIPFSLNITWLEINGILSQRSREQGSRFFREGYIHGVTLGVAKTGSSTTVDASSTTVDAKCYRSMRKSEPPHKLFLTVADDKLEDALCSCTAG